MLVEKRKLNQWTVPEQGRWQLTVSPDGLQILIVTRIVAILVQQNTAVTLSRCDTERKIQWTADSLLVAVMDTDGRVNIIDIVTLSVTHSIISQQPCQWLQWIDPMARGASIFAGQRYQHELLVGHNELVSSFLVSRVTDGQSVTLRVAEPVASKVLAFQHTFPLQAENVCKLSDTLLLIDATRIYKLLPMEPHCHLEFALDKVATVRSTWIGRMLGRTQKLSDNAVTCCSCLGDRVLVTRQDGSIMMFVWSATTLQQMWLKKSTDFDVTVTAVQWWTSDLLCVVHASGICELRRAVDFELKGEFANSVSHEWSASRGVLYHLSRDVEVSKKAKQVVAGPQSPWQLVFSVAHMRFAWLVNMVLWVQLIRTAPVIAADTSADQVQCTYTLEHMRETTADELLKIRMDAADFKGALAVAVEHKLATDAVYMRWWSNETSVTQSIIDDILTKVRDSDMWVLEQCVQSVCMNAETQRALYEFGMRVSDELARVLNLSADVVTLSDKQKRVVQMRYALIYCQDSLRAFIEIQWNSQLPFTAMFGEFRWLSRVDVSCWFAARENYAALDVVFKYFDMQQHMTAILDCVPETADISDIRKYVSAANWQNLREQDWGELVATRCFDIGRDAGNNMVTPLWIATRAQQIEDTTSLCQQALQFAMLDPTAETTLMSFMAAYMLDTGMPVNVQLQELPEASVYQSFREVSTMTVRQRAEWIMSRGKSVYETRGISALFVHDVSTHLVPYIIQERQSALLYSLMTEIARKDLPLVYEYVLSVQRVDVKMYECMLDCCLACKSSVHYEIMQRILDIVVDSKAGVDRQKLYDLQNLLAVATELDVYELDVDPDSIRRLAVDSAAQRNLLTRMSRLPLMQRSRDAVVGKFVTVSDVGELLDSMVHIRTTVCTSVSVHDVESMLVGALLSGNDSTVKLAHELLFPSTARKQELIMDHLLKLTNTDIENLICNAAMAFLDTAESGDDLNMSLKILRIVPQSRIDQYSKILQQLEYVQAVQELCTVHRIRSDETQLLLLPVEIRQQRDTVQLLRIACMSSTKLYNDVQSIRKYHDVLKRQHGNVTDLEADILLFLQMCGAWHFDDYATCATLVQQCKSVKRTSTHYIDIRYMLHHIASGGKQLPHDLKAEILYWLLSTGASDETSPSLTEIAQEVDLLSQQPSGTAKPRDEQVDTMHRVFDTSMLMMFGDDAQHAIGELQNIL